MLQFFVLMHVLMYCNYRNTDQISNNSIWRPLIEDQLTRNKMIFIIFALLSFTECSESAVSVQVRYREINVVSRTLFKSKKIPQRKPFEVSFHKPQNKSENSVDEFSKYTFQRQKERVPLIKEKVSKSELTFCLILYFSCKNLN